MNLEDYSAIRAIIDDIIGVETKQGENLKGIKEEHSQNVEL